MRRLVVADDNVAMVAALRIFLRRCGWEVIGAHDGLTALAAIQEACPPVALIDIGLPKLDGLELAQRVRAGGAVCRLVAMSGFGTARDRDRSERAGFDLHLVKPIDPGVLRAALELAPPVSTSESARP
jgi:DNA-binding response OmpR family regulator